jgi:hypothetical protein
MASQLIDVLLQTMEDEGDCLKKSDIFHQMLEADYDIFDRFKSGGKSTTLFTDFPPLLNLPKIS